MVQFIDLWRAHPINESVTNPCVAPGDVTNALHQQVRGGDPTYPDQAAIRLGVALRRTGVSITELGNIPTCGVHLASDMHILESADLASALRRVRLPGFGPVEVISGDDVRMFFPKIVGRTGILFIKDFWMRESDQLGQPTGDHIDVWNGYRTSGQWLMEWFSWVGYYSNYTGAREIWFWEVT